MARDFNGSSQYGTAAAAAANLDIGTFAAWYQPDFDPSSSTNINFYHIDLTGGNGYELNLHIANTIRAERDNRLKDVTVTGLWSAGSWVHIAIAYNKTGSVIQIYVNGVEIGAGGAQSGTWGTATLGTNMRLGVNGGLSSGFFDGDIAEVGMWSVVLDAAEIAALAKGFSPSLIRPTSLNAYWPIFGNNSPELDRRKNAYDLTLTASPAKSDHPRMYYTTGNL